MHTLETYNSEHELVPLRISIHQTAAHDLNKERIDCLISEYSLSIYPDADYDILGIICNYYGNEYPEIGHFVTTDQYFGNGSVHIDAISCAQHQNEWPQYLYDQRKKGIQTDIIFIFLTFLIEIGSIIGLFYLLRDKRIISFIMVLFFSLTVLILCCKGIYKFIQTLTNPVLANYSLLKFDIHNNVVQEWRMKVCKIKTYGNISYNDAKYFCQLTDVIKLSYISAINQITLHKPYTTESHGSVQGSSYAHTQYNEGYIRFNNVMSVRLPYGADCPTIKHSIKEILENVNQSFHWTIIDKNK